MRRVAVVALLVLAGCAQLRSQDEARMRHEATADHAACVATGHDFPSDAYNDCRRMHAEQRQRKRWMELALAQQQERERTPNDLPVAPPGVYLPIDAARFGCEQRGELADPWIDCRER